MHKITIGLSRHTDFAIFGRSIEWFQNTKYSHTYLRFDSEEMERTLIYQASGLKVNFMNIQEFTKINTIVKEWIFEVDDDLYRKILGFCVDEVGKPYSIKAIWGIFCYTLFKWKSIDSDKLDSFICSELIGYILKMCGIIKENIDLDYFTPKDVETTISLYLSSN